MLLYTLGDSASTHLLLIQIVEEERVTLVNNEPSG